MKNVHVIGSTGMVGSELVKRGCKRLDCDITNPNSIVQWLKQENPSTIILCAAKTGVDWCDTYPIDAMAVNTKGVSNLVDVFKGRLIYISSDYIFNGKKFLGLGYHEDSSPNPVNVYGQTKLAGEMMSKWGWSDTRIIRTSKLFNQKYIDDKLGSGEKFSTIMKRSFLHVTHFVDGLQFVLDNWEKIPIILNVAGTDVMSYYMFFSAVAKHRGLVPETVVPNDKYDNSLVARPKRCGLIVSIAKRLGVPLYSAFEGIELL